MKTKASTRNLAAFGMIAALCVVTAPFQSYAVNTGSTYTALPYGSGLGRDVRVGDRYCAGDVTKPVSVNAGNGVVTTDKPITRTTDGGYWYYASGSGDCVPTKAFDNGTNYSDSKSRALVAWNKCGGKLNIVYTLTNGTAHAIGGYRIAVDQKARAPKTWTIYGSNDYNPANASPTTAGNDMSSATWTIIDSRSDETDWAEPGYRTFTCNGDYTTAYQSIRICVTACNASDWLTFAEIEYYGYYRSCAGDITTPVSVTAGNGVVTTDKPLTLNGTGGTAAGIWYNNNKTDAAYFCYPDRAFDDRTEYSSGQGRALARWSNCGGQLSIVYTFTNGMAHAIGGYRIIVDQGGRAPKAWTIYGSNDYNPANASPVTAGNDMTASWSVIDSRSNETGWTNGGERTFTCNGDCMTAYRSIRICVTACNASDWLTFGEIEYFAYCSGNPNGGIPDLAEGGTATCRPAQPTLWYSSNDGTRIFDNSIGTGMRGIVFGDVLANLNASVDMLYTFATPAPVNAYRMLPETDGNVPHVRPPKAWRVIGSNDYNPADRDVLTNATWTVLDERHSETGWAKSESRIYTFTNATPYRTLRLQVLRNNGGNYLGDDYTTIYELEYFALPTLTVVGADNRPVHVLALDPNYARDYSASLATLYKPGDTVTLLGTPTDPNVSATCTGYTLETFNASTGSWTTTATGGETSLTLELSAAPQRLTWLYAAGVTYTLSAAVDGAGTLDNTTVTAAKGGTASFTATPADASQSVVWKGDVAGATYSADGSTITIPADFPRSITATFETPLAVSGRMTIDPALRWNEETQPLGSSSVPASVTAGGTLDVNYSEAVPGVTERGLVTHTKEWTVVGDGDDGKGVLQNNGTKTAYYAFGKVHLAGDASFGGTTRFDFRPNASSPVAPDRVTLDQLEGVNATLTVRCTNVVSFADVNLKAINVAENAQFGVANDSVVKTDVANGGYLNLAAGSELFLYDISDTTLSGTAIAVNGAGATILASDTKTNVVSAPITIAEGASLNLRGGTVAYESAITGDLSMSGGTAYLRSAQTGTFTQRGGTLHIDDSYSGTVNSTGGRVDLYGTLPQSCTFTKTGGDLYIYEGFNDDVAASATTVYIMGSPAGGSLTKTGNNSVGIGNGSIDMPYIDLSNFTMTISDSDLYCRPKAGTTMVVEGLNVSFPTSNRAFCFSGASSSAGTWACLTNMTVGAMRFLVGVNWGGTYCDVRLKDGTTITVEQVRLAYNSGAYGNTLIIEPGATLNVTKQYVGANSGSGTVLAPSRVIVDGGTLDCSYPSLTDFVLTNAKSGNGWLILNDGLVKVGAKPIMIRNGTNNDDDYRASSGVSQRLEINGGTFEFAGPSIANGTTISYGEADVVFAGGTFRASNDFRVEGYIPVLFRNNALTTSTVARYANDEAFTLDVGGHKATFTTALSGEGNVILTGAGTFAGTSEVQGVISGSWIVDEGMTASLEGAASVLGGIFVGTGASVAVDVATNRSAVFTGRAGGGLPGTANCYTNAFNRIASGSTLGTITHNESLLFTKYAQGSRPFGDRNNTTAFAYGEFYVEEDGTWYFKGVCDDRVLFYVDDELVLASTSASDIATGSRELSAGWHTFRHFCIDNTGAFGHAQTVGYNTDGSSTYADFSVKNLKMRPTSPAGGRNTVRRKYFAGNAGYESQRDYNWNLCCVANSSAARAANQINDYEGWFYVPAEQAGTWSFTLAAQSALQIAGSDCLINWTSSAGTAEQITLAAGWHRYWARYMGAAGTVTKVSIEGAPAVTFGAENEAIWFSLCPDGYMQGDIWLAAGATLENKAANGAASVTGEILAEGAGTTLRGAFSFDGGTLNFGTVPAATRDLGSVIAIENPAAGYLAHATAVKVRFDGEPSSGLIKVCPAGGLTAEEAAAKLDITVAGAPLGRKFRVDVRNDTICLSRGGMMIIVR